MGFRCGKLGITSELFEVVPLGVSGVESRLRHEAGR